MSAYLARIEIFPIKSMDGLSISQATVLASGALAGDRTYALFDAQGRFINAKRTAAIQRLRTRFSADGATVTLQINDSTASATFHLQEQGPELEAWLSHYFEQPVSLASNPAAGFPDDTHAAGPTVISTATLQAVAEWYSELSLEEVRRRFRTNLEIGGVPAFWEDQLFAAAGDTIEFSIGNGVLQGVNPCQRCIVPTRDADSGAPLPDFQKTFTQQRQATLPPWAERRRFNHFYRLAVNTNILGQGGKTLAVGDPVGLTPGG